MNYSEEDQCPENQERVIGSYFQTPTISLQLLLPPTEQATLSPKTPESELTVHYGTQEQRHDSQASACLLDIPKDSPLLQRQWLTRESSQDFETDDPLVQLDKLQKIIVEVKQVKTSLENCLTQKLGENEVNMRKLSISECELESTKKDLNLCQTEREEYKQKYAQATEIIAEMDQSFQEQYVSITEKCQEAKQVHEQKEADLRYTLKLQDRCVNNLEAKLKHRDSELKKFKSKYKDKQGEVEKMREILMQKEKELKEMETELEEKSSEVKILKKWTKDEALNEKQKMVGKNLQTCQEIKKLLECFQDIRTQEELEKINSQILEEITKMKASMKHKKSFSWR